MSRKKCSSRNDNFDLKTYYSIENTCGYSKCTICMEKNRNCDCSDKSKNLEVSKLKVARRRRVTLPSHIIIIEGDTVTYKCSICHCCFKSRASLTHHRYCDNTVEKPYKCDFCNKRFATKNHHSYHVMEHTGQLPFPCTTCDKRFKTKAKMQRHERTHVDKVEEHTCHICRRKVRREYLREHVKRHLMEKSYECYTCQRTFTDKKTLVNHVNTHFGTKNWICEFCGKSFGLKWNMDLHRTTHIRSGLYYCTECKRSFFQKRYLQRHYETHKDGVKFICDMCEKHFSRKDNLERHILNSHMESREKDNNISVNNINSSVPVSSENGCLNEKGVISEEGIEIFNVDITSHDNSGNTDQNTKNCNTRKSVIKSISKTDGIKDFEYEQFDQLSDRRVSVIKKTAACFPIQLQREVNNRVTVDTIAGEYHFMVPYGDFDKPSAIEVSLSNNDNVDIICNENYMDNNSSIYSCLYDCCNDSHRQLTSGLMLDDEDIMLGETLLPIPVAVASSDNVTMDEADCERTIIGLPPDDNRNVFGTADDVLSIYCKNTDSLVNMMTTWSPSLSSTNRDDTSFSSLFHQPPSSPPSLFSDASPDCITIQNDTHLKTDSGNSDSCCRLLDLSVRNGLNCVHY